MSYQRVIPRDLFNESKLLKCLGRLALLLHNHEGRWPIMIAYEGEAFDIRQDASDAGLYCSNLTLLADGRGSLKANTEIKLKSHYNNRNSYPLEFAIGDELGDVFDDNGDLTTEFEAAIGGVVTG